MFINQKITKIFILFFCFSIFSSISQTNEDIPLNNIAINETPIPVSSIIFEDFSGNKINLEDYEGKLVIINFWATWCAPCRKEMPSLNALNGNENFKTVATLRFEGPIKVIWRSDFADVRNYFIRKLIESNK